MKTFGAQVVGRNVPGTGGFVCWATESRLFPWPLFKAEGFERGCGMDVAGFGFLKCCLIWGRELSNKNPIWNQ